MQRDLWAQLPYPPLLRKLPKASPVQLIDLVLPSHGCCPLLTHKLTFPGTLLPRLPFRGAGLQVCPANEVGCKEQF